MVINFFAFKLSNKRSESMLAFACNFVTCILVEKLLGNTIQLNEFKRKPKTEFRM